MPKLEHVNWDTAAAAAAMRALRHAADTIERTASERLRAADHACQEWRGAHRETFDESLLRRLNEAYDLADRYRAAAADIATHTERARALNRRREREEQHRKENQH